MAQDEVFAGPMSESVPSSITGFAHRRGRAESTASFTYFQDEDESPEWSDDQAVIDVIEEDQSIVDQEQDAGIDLERGPVREGRKSSGYSRASVERPLLRHLDSGRTNISLYVHGRRSRQKIYVTTEDLTIAVAGFSTNWLGFAIYVCLCTMSAGIVYLVLRWIPRWRVKLIGTEAPLRECDWTVIEVRWLPRRRKSSLAKRNQNQWGEFQIQKVSTTSYGHAISTVFGSEEEKATRYASDEDDDPVIANLRILDYRYVRFCYHPLKDKFVLCSDWKDPSWTDVKTMKLGLDVEERYRREQVFDRNIIDIQEKSIPQLLVDEVSSTKLPVPQILTFERFCIHSTCSR